MKYRLIHYKDLSTVNDWEYELDVSTIFCNHDGCRIKYASQETENKITLSLTSIPKRIDIETLFPNSDFTFKNAWVLSDEDADLLEAPFMASKSSTGVTIFERKDDDNSK